MRLSPEAPFQKSEHAESERAQTFDSDFNSLKAKMRAFGPGVTGYFIVIPSAMINTTTGEPTKELIGSIRKTVGTFSGQEQEKNAA